MNLAKIFLLELILAIAAILSIIFKRTTDNIFFPPTSIIVLLWVIIGAFIIYVERR